MKTQKRIALMLAIILILNVFFPIFTARNTVSAATGTLENVSLIMNNLRNYQKRE